MFFIKSKGKYYQFDENNSQILIEKQKQALDNNNMEIDDKDKSAHADFVNYLMDKGYTKEEAQEAANNIYKVYKNYSEDQLALNKLQNFGSLNHAAKTVSKLFKKADKLDDAAHALKSMTAYDGEAKKIALEAIEKERDKVGSDATKIMNAMSKRKTALIYKDATGKSLKGYESFRPYNNDEKYMKIVAPDASFKTKITTNVQDKKGISEKTEKILEDFI